MTGEQWMKLSISFRLASLALLCTGGVMRIKALHKMDREKLEAGNNWDVAIRKELAPATEE